MGINVLGYQSYLLQHCYPYLCEWGITTRGCSGGKRFNDTRFYEVGSGDVGKELPRTKSVVCVSFVGRLSHEVPQETFPGCVFVPGI